MKFCPRGHTFFSKSLLFFALFLRSLVFFRPIFKTSKKCFGRRRRRFLFLSVTLPILLLTFIVQKKKKKKKNKKVLPIPSRSPSPRSMNTQGGGAPIRARHHSHYQAQTKIGTKDVLLSIYIDKQRRTAAELTLQKVVAESFAK